MFGPSLLVAPQIEAASTLLEVYFPATQWYDWYNSRRVDSRGQVVFVPSPNTTVALFTRGGSIIAGRALNRSLTDIHLIVSPDSSDYAYGELVIDDGVRPGTFLTGRYSMFHFSYMKTLYLFDIGHKLRQPFAITVARV
ncbi:uncharacterized protein LOC142766889 [Rhipicephalus microplus]|uniref:uncharacterized protein LOC142766889 n=1 Tax=Rhipicephalus microplus TaxID=6941 RepID=UPI003F6AB6E3